MGNEIERRVESGDDLIGRDDGMRSPDFSDYSNGPDFDETDTAAARFAEASEALSGLAWVERRISQAEGRLHTEPGLPIKRSEDYAEPNPFGPQDHLVPPEPPVGTVFCYQRLLGGKHYTYVSVRTGDGRWWTTGNSRQGVTWPELVAALREPRVQRPVMLAASWQPYAPLETR